MKSILISLLGLFLLFSCSNSKNSIVCKNEVKVVKTKQFKEPYSYQKISKRKLEKVQAKKSDKKELKSKLENKQEDNVYADIDDNSINISKNPIQERIRNHKKMKIFTPEPAPAQKVNGLGIAGFVVWLFGLFAAVSAGIPLIYTIGGILSGVSLFIMAKRKSEFVMKGFSMVAPFINGFINFLYALIFFALGGAIGAGGAYGGLGALVAILGVVFLLFAAFYIAALIYYFTQN